MTNRAPLIVAIVLLLLPVLYVASYFALVNPAPSGDSVRFLPPQGNYRCDRKVARVFWPLEQLDRKLRPNYWVWEEKLEINFED